jgi:hypothetical protein
MENGRPEDRGSITYMDGLRKVEDVDDDNN